ncbi:MAG: hypothetical protein HGA96_04065 [Desulfobulbaceae bacterium]|nr:hypothetical protein [Desulfobulbaceae bacterium]
MDITGCFNKACGLTLILLLANFVSPGPGIAGTPVATADTCVTCHEDTWRYIQSQRYIHQPDGAKDCKYCHAASRGNTEAKRETYLNKVTWVARSVNPSREHWLEIDGVIKGATMLVESRSSGGLSAREFPLPAFSELEDLPVSDLKPLGITNIRLLEVTKGVFVSATIGWETNRQADSQVFYGLDKPDQRSTLDTQYTTNHAVTLTGIKLGKSYKYKVISVDVAGNRSESNVQSMTAEVLQGSYNDKTSERTALEPDVAVKYYRKGNKCIVVVGADRLINVALGILPKKYENSDTESDAKIIRHLLLNSPEITNTGICYNCHIEYKKILTHPINVYPKRKMTIPKEYPTLPDGRITCMSCHVAHASNVEFRLVKADKRELCQGCHKDIS